jgi:hypothetical protein
MLLIILPVLILVLGLAHDLGNVAAGVAVAQNAADLAAQEAAKLVDVDHYRAYGEMRLRPAALALAGQVAGELTGGAFRVRDVYTRGNLAIVEGEVSVRTPFLETFLGRRAITRPVQAAAEAVYGTGG